LRRQAPRRGGGSAPRLEGLGTLHRAVTTSSPEAQAFFDQGLRLTFAFNYEEAQRSYSEAARLDPSCAMCEWGVALAQGPDPRRPSSADQAEAVYRAHLERVPGDPWALFGVVQALTARKAPEADDARRAFAKAWEKADVKLEATAFW
jgi:tetratricopeptide (TPR) repeat protein